jgi:hypothetical protein
VFTIDDEDDDDDDDANENTTSSGNNRASAKSPIAQVSANEHMLIRKMFQSKSPDGASSHGAAANRVPVNLNAWLRENNVDSRTHCFEAQHVEADTKLLRVW